ncbi:MAG: hypothetical protein JMJ93_03650 [Synergistaceae bacterium]|jgi:hypothetical protein|nr:hypothetical protein [Synergistaceae bacterium]
MTTTGNLVSLVLERLRLPRVGLLWWHETAPHRFAPPPGVTWVHYLAPGCVFPRELRPAYRLAALKAPEEEAGTLRMLAVPAARIELLADLLSGLPASPEGRLVAGCLGAGLPVVVDVSALASRSRWTGAIGNGHREALGRLEALGCLLLRGEMSPASPTSPVTVGERTAPDVLVVDEPGWLSWRELAPRLGGRRAVSIGPEVRLTAEARDRLRQHRIALKEG